MQWDVTAPEQAATGRVDALLWEVQARDVSGGSAGGASDAIKLSQRIVHDCAPQLGRLADCASATQADLDDQLERTEYALIDDEDALGAAREQAAEARAAWLRAVSQTGSAQTLVGDARKAVLSERDTRLDREDPPARAANALF